MRCARRSAGDRAVETGRKGEELPDRIREPASRKALLVSVKPSTGGRPKLDCVLSWNPESFMVYQAMLARTRKQWGVTTVIPRSTGNSKVVGIAKIYAVVVHGRRKKNPFLTVMWGRWTRSFAGSFLAL